MLVKRLVRDVTMLVDAHVVVVDWLCSALGRYCSVGGDESCCDSFVDGWRLGGGWCRVLSWSRWCWSRWGWGGAVETGDNTAESEDGVCRWVARKRIDIVVIDGVKTGAYFVDRAVPGWARADGCPEIHSVAEEWTIGVGAVDVGAVVPNEVLARVAFDGVLELRDRTHGGRLGELEGDTTGGGSMIALGIGALGLDNRGLAWVSLGIDGPRVHIKVAVVVDNGAAHCVDR